MSSKFDRMIQSLSDKQIALARAFQSAGITTYSQAVKALYNRDDERIAEWKAALNPAPKVEETTTDEATELVTVVFEDFEMDMTAETTEEEIAAFVGTAEIDDINESEIAERAYRLANDRGYITSRCETLTDAGEIEQYLLELARERAQERIDHWVGGLMAAHEEAFRR